MIEIQVKTRSNRSGSMTLMLGKQVPPIARSEREWFVFVLLPPDLEAPPVALVVPRDHISAGAWIHNHYQNKVSKLKRKTNFDQVTIPRDFLSGYMGRWDLLDIPTNEIPVLLPRFLRDRAQRDGVGLPPGHRWNDELPENWYYPGRVAPADWQAPTDMLP
jgi:hypothetical protein